MRPEKCAEYSSTVEFLRGLWLGESAPRRPGIVWNECIDTSNPPVPAPQAHPHVPYRVKNGDDFIPQVDTNNGPNAMPSAFLRSDEFVGAHWTGKLYSGLSELSNIVKPGVESGLVGEAIERTRELRATTELSIRSLDLQSPLTTATQLFGVSEVFVAMYDHPKQLHSLLEMLTEFTIDVVEAQRRAADGRFSPIYWPWIWSPDEVGLELSDDYMLSLSPEQFDEFSLPCLSRLAEHFGGLFLHSCTIYDRNLPSIAKIPNLRGINSDLSMSAPVRNILDALPGVVYSPHIYMNKEISRPTQADWLRDILSIWKPGDRLFPAVLAVIYDDATQTDLATDWGAVKEVWREMGWDVSLENHLG